MLSIESGNRLDENGKLVFYPSQPCEACKGVTNPVDVIAGLQACLEGLLEIAEVSFKGEKVQQLKATPQRT